MHISIEEIGGRGSGKPYEPLELMACVMARAMRDGEIVGTGAGSAVARAAARLAQLTHAPHLYLIAGGSGAVNPLLEPLVPSSCDFNNLLCEAVLDLPDYVASVAGGRVDLFCYGGLQVDRYGNTNLSLLGPDPARPRLRGPGSAALPVVSAVGRSIIFVTDHSPRTLVEKVSFVTAPGFLDGGPAWRAARAGGRLTGNGPALVVTPLAALDFDDESKAMRLLSVHPGVTVEQVRAATGFELAAAPEVPVTSPPTGEELRLLRAIDEDRLLKG